jgi:AP-1 complex subunit gamma-1
MPVPEARTIIQQTSTDGSSNERGRSSSGRAGPSDQDLLLDLMGVGTSGGSGGHVEQVDMMSQSPVAASSPAPPKQSNVDLLADLFGGGGDSGSSQPSPSPASAPVATSNNLMDLLGGGETTTQQPSSPAASNYGLDSLAGLSQNMPGSPLSSMGSPAMSKPTQSSPAASGYEAYTKNGLTIRLLPSKDRTNPAIINIQVLFSNNGSQGIINDLQFQAAVPKSQRLQMNAASNTTVQPNTTEKQIMRINNPQQVSVYH